MRLSQTFERTKSEHRPALAGYITAGDPDIEASLAILDDACSSGLDILELGIPFSDPTADGPVIQRASQRAIKAGMNVTRGLEFVQRLRQKYTLPIILFTYYNPILAYGAKRFVADAVTAGADGVLVVDLPSEFAAELTQYIPTDKNTHFHFIRFIAPTTDIERRKQIMQQADGFVYVVSRKGVTGGTAKIDWAALSDEVSALRMYQKIPLCIGFGLSNAADVRAAGQITDGVVVGSAIQQRIETGLPVSSFIRELRYG